MAVMLFLVMISVAALAAMVAAYLGTVGTFVLALCGITSLFERRPAPLSTESLYSAHRGKRAETALCGTNSDVSCRNPNCNAENPRYARFCRRCRTCLS